MKLFFLLLAVVGTSWSLYRYWKTQHDREIGSRVSPRWLNEHVYQRDGDNPYTAERG